MSIPLLVAVGVRRDGQKVLLAVKNMGGETEAAWRHVSSKPSPLTSPAPLTDQPN